MDEIREDIDEFVQQYFKVEKGRIKEDDALMDLGVVYSIGLIALINHIERNYNIVVEDRDISLENFGTIRNIVNYISERQ